MQPNQPTKALEILDIIDKFLSSNSVKEDQKGFLWDILAALRGPDNQNYKIKQETTEVIRSRAFIRTSTKYGAQVPANFSKDPYKIIPTLIYDHFSGHIYYAARALDEIGWERKREREREREERDKP